MPVRRGEPVGDLGIVQRAEIIESNPLRARQRMVSLNAP
jgi:hypothetical protein